MIPVELKSVNAIYRYFVERYAPNRAVMGFEEQPVTLGEMTAQVDVFTRHLVRLGVKRGTRVGYTMPNCPDVVVLFFAISRLGACAIPLFPMLPDLSKVDVYLGAAAELVITTAAQLGPLKEASLAKKAGYRMATVDPNQAGEYHFQLPLEDVANPAEDWIDEPALPFLVGSSSGTTGIPKRVILTQGNVAAEIRSAAQMTIPVVAEVGENNREVGAFPLSTSVIITCLGLLLGGTMLICAADTSPAKYVHLLAYWKAGRMSAPPAYYEAILALPSCADLDLSSVKSIHTGMDFLTPSLLSRLKARFTGLVQFVNGYGLVETANVFMQCKGRIEGENLKTTLMQLIECGGDSIEVRNEAGVTVGAGQQGELYVKGESVIAGYAENPAAKEQSFKDGWFRTGDIVINEGDNRVTLLGRKKYLIKRGGKSVSPIVVQNLINRLEGVKNSAVVGVPHPLYGEMVWAFIVPQPGVDLQLKTIMKHCRTELANYMVPDQVRFIDDVPKNGGVGKVNYEALKEMAAQELQGIG